MTPQRTNQAILFTLATLVLLVLCSALLTRTLNLGQQSPNQVSGGPETDAPAVFVSLTQGNLAVGLSALQDETTQLGPQAITTDESGNIYVLDSLNRRVLQIAPAGGLQQTISLSQTGFLKDLVVQNQRLYLLDTSADRVWAVDDAGAVLESYPYPPRLERGLSGLSVTSAGEVRLQVQNATEIALVPQSYIDQFGPNAAVQAEQTGLSLRASVGNAENETVRTIFTRLGDSVAELSIFDRQRQQIQTLRLETDHYLGSMILRGIDAEGYFYVQVDEILPNIPTFIVDTTLHRFSPDGQLNAIAPIPTENSTFIPTRFVTLNDAGQAYFLQVEGQTAQLITLNFAPADRYNDGLSERWTAWQDNPPQPLSEAIPLAEFIPDSETPAMQSVQPTVDRSQTLVNAFAYLSVNWRLTEANYAAGTLICNEANWALPGYLEKRVGQVIPEVAYQWGGYSTVSQFQQGISAGKLAGDACTCTDPDLGYCINRNESVGVDCSGFISRVWETGRYTTRTLPDISNEIPWHDLRPGDVVNWAGTHVMMFDQLGNGGLLGPESSSDCNWRTCYGFRSYAHLNERYVARRYINIIEDGETPTRPTPTPRPLVSTPTPGPDDAPILDLSVAGSTLQPGQSTLVSAIFVNQNGVPLGRSTVMTFSTNLGQIDPITSATDSNYFATVSYTAPTTQSGTASLTVTDGAYTASQRVIIASGDSLLPGIPRNPSPVDGADNVAVGFSPFRWESGHPAGQSVVYTLTLGAIAPGTSTTPDLQASTVQLTQSQISLANTFTLLPGTLYEWQVQASDGISRVNGPVWQFRTVNRLNSRVYLPLMFIDR